MQQTLLDPDWPASEVIVFPSLLDVLFIRSMCSAALPLQEYVPFWIINTYSFHYLVSHMTEGKKKGNIFHKSIAVDKSVRFQS